jgi:hypothetical protein
MKKVVKFFTVLELLSVIVSPLVARAASFDPLIEEHRQLK